MSVLALMVIRTSPCPGWALHMHRKWRAIPEIAAALVNSDCGSRISFDMAQDGRLRAIFADRKSCAHRECGHPMCIQSISVETQGHGVPRTMVRSHQSDVPPPPMDSDACPYVDRNHGCCRARFSLDRLDHLMHTCFGDFRSCPHHDQLRSLDDSPGESSTSVIITLRRHLVHEQLRPTGS